MGGYGCSSGPRRRIVSALSLAEEMGDDFLLGDTRPFYPVLARYSYCFEQRQKEIK